MKYVDSSDMNEKVSPELAAMDEIGDRLLPEESESILRTAKYNLEVMVVTERRPHGTGKIGVVWHEGPEPEDGWYTVHALAS